MSSAEDMVNNVLADLANGDRISRLGISGEGIVRNGRFIGVQMGEQDLITRGNFALFSDMLARLGEPYERPGSAP